MFRGESGLLFIQLWPTVVYLAGLKVIFPFQTVLSSLIPLFGYLHHKIVCQYMRKQLTFNLNCWVDQYKTKKLEGSYVWCNEKKKHSVRLCHVLLCYLRVQRWTAVHYINLYFYSTLIKVGKGLFIRGLFVTSSNWLMAMMINLITYSIMTWITRYLVRSSFCFLLPVLQSVRNTEQWVIASRGFDLCYNSKLSSDSHVPKLFPYEN